MCTLVLAWQVFPEAPVLVAANRDEQLDRPSEPPAVRDWETRAVAPIDEEAEGTWIGYNDHGLLVAITNSWSDGSLEGERSRGLLVRDALDHETAEAAARFVEREIAAREYEGFNLVVADEAAAIYLEWSGRLRVYNFDPGIHVVVNVGADGRYAIPPERQDRGQEQAANADAVRTALRPEPGESDRDWLDHAAEVVADHDFGVCVHGEGFGTRSSSLIRLGEDGSTYEFAPGPPCETAYEPVDAEL